MEEKTDSQTHILPYLLNKEHGLATKWHNFRSGFCVIEVPDGHQFSIFF